MTTTNTNERLLRFLHATPEQQELIDQILEGEIPSKLDSLTGPLLLAMGEGAIFIGVGRSTLWRMIKAGRLSKVEILPGSFRVRRADLEAIATGQKKVAQ